MTKDKLQNIEDKIKKLTKEKKEIELTQAIELSKKINKHLDKFYNPNTPEITSNYFVIGALNEALKKAQNDETYLLQMVTSGKEILDKKSKKIDA